ncbi:MAG TPA: methyltransferase domain-containing protein [Methylothermaceae bacterium]|nr:methyltransferase domain-containing protein [Methylothermaceae bacterium]
MPSPLQDKWDRIHADAGWPAPARVLVENLHLLPHQGLALEAACGLGANALLLARRGLTVTAWDISPVAIDRLQRRAEREGLPLRAEVRDIESGTWPRETWDVIVVTRFLNRDLCSRIQAALKPGGLLLYQTFVRHPVTPVGPSNPAYRLEENELLRLFAGLIVRAYREENHCGDLSRGLRNEAYLVAQKPMR